MRYNEKYGRWFTKGGLVYRYDSKQDKLVLCNQTKLASGYYIFRAKGKNIKIHRAIYETFVGEIPNCYVIDHINTNKDDNRLENLRCVTQSENLLNTITRQHRSDLARNRLNSSFGKKYFEHFGYSQLNNVNQYKKELMWYRRHNNKCRWEKE